jgi:hypothetical protein
MNSGKVEVKGDCPHTSCLSAAVAFFDRRNVVMVVAKEAHT